MKEGWGKIRKTFFEGMIRKDVLKLARPREHRAYFEEWTEAGKR